MTDSRQRFGNQICSLDQLIKPSLSHTRLFLPIYYVEKDTDDRVSMTGHNTRFAHNNSSFNSPADTTYADKVRQSNTKKEIEASQKRNQEAQRILKQEELDRQKAESERRRNQQLQGKKELQLKGDIHGLDDTMFDPEKQQQIMDKIKNENRGSQQNSSQGNGAIHEQFSTKQVAPQQLMNQDQLQQPVNQDQPVDPNQLRILSQIHQTGGQNQHNIDQGQYPKGPSQPPYGGPSQSQDHKHGLSPNPVGTTQQNMGQNQYLHGQGPPPTQGGYHGRNQQQTHQGMGQGYHSMEHFEGQLQHSQQHQHQHPLSNQQQQGVNLPYIGSGGRGDGGRNFPQQQQQIPQYSRHPSCHGTYQDDQYTPVYPHQQQQQYEMNKILRAETEAPMNVDNGRMFQNSSQPYGGNGVFQCNMLPPPVETHNEGNFHHGTSQPPHTGSSLRLEVGDAIESGDPPRYGIIKYIGELPGTGQVAGVEMVISYSASIFCKYKENKCPLEYLQVLVTTLGILTFYLYDPYCL